WLVQHGVRPMLAHVLILAVLVGGLMAVGEQAYESVAAITPARVEGYRERLEQLVNRAAATAGYHGTEPASVKFRSLFGSSEMSGQDILAATRGVAGSFFGALTFTLVVVIYLIFLM